MFDEVYILIEKDDSWDGFTIHGVYPDYDSAAENRAALVEPIDAYHAGVAAYWDRLNVMRDEIVGRLQASSCSRPMGELTYREKRAVSTLSGIVEFKTRFRKENFPQGLQAELEGLLQDYPADDLDRSRPWWPPSPIRDDVKRKGDFHIKRHTIWG